MPLELVTAPTEQPVTVAEAREYLRIDDKDTDENLLYGLIKAATQQAEEYTGRALVTQTWDLKLDCWWHGELLLPKAPLQSVTSITYLDADGDSQTWASSNYVVDSPNGNSAVQGRIGYADGITTPELDDIINPVTVRFVAGYGDADDVPELIKLGIKQLVSDMYENRQGVITGSIAQLMPQNWKFWLSNYRIVSFA